MKLFFELSILLSAMLFSAKAASVARFLRTNGGGKRNHRILARDAAGSPSIIVGNLGKIKLPPTMPNQGVAFAMDDDATMKALAKDSLKTFLKDHMGLKEEEDVEPVNIIKDEQGSHHVRFDETIRGLPVEGAALVMHIDKQGTVYAVNGEMIADSDVPAVPAIDCDSAMDTAVKQHYAIPEGKEYGWTTECLLTTVYGEDGNVHLAWKRMVTYQPDGYAPRQKDWLFASASTGNLVALHPQVLGATPSLRTYDCQQRTSACSLVSTSNTPINSTDAVLNAAQNYALATYFFFLEEFGRDSMDGNGMTIIIRIHYGDSYNNAYWDGEQITFGDGDGVTFGPLCLDPDVVAHELAHAWTMFDSGLIYRYESGAINEAISDIIGAAVDRRLGASREDTFALGKKIYTPSIPGDALRYLADPAKAGDADYYPDRFTGSEDNGHVHSNSGILNLAFALMVNGGRHPRNKTTVEVPAIDEDFDMSLKKATKIVYDTNSGCLTPNSGFAAARFCMHLHAGNNTESVEAAFEAVGVPDAASTEPVELRNGEILTGQSGATGTVQSYVLKSVPAGAKVTCITTGSNGDIDLYTRFDAEAIASPGISVNECEGISFNSYEDCTTEEAPHDNSSLFVALHAYDGYSGATVRCSYDEPQGAIVLDNGKPLSTQDSLEGAVKRYTMAVAAGQVVTCQLYGENGDADLYVRFQDDADPTPNSALNNCQSLSSSSHELCTTAAAEEDGIVFIAVHAFARFSDLWITCSAYLV